MTTAVIILYSLCMDTLFARLVTCQPSVAKVFQPMSKRVGVFSGTFDPVHRGHVESCVVALGALNLDTVLIMIEKQPRRKTGVAEFIDRANMVELAVSDFPSLRLVDLESDNVTTDNTLKYLEDNFPGGEYWYIIGSDVLEHIQDWPGHKKLLESFHLCVVLRDNDELSTVKKRLAELEEKYECNTNITLPSVWSPVSSSTVKAALKKGEIITSLDPAVREYIQRHKLYQ